MTFILLLLFYLVLVTQGADVHRRDTGDSQCTPLMCISALVNGSTVQYILQSTGSNPLGWMAMGFGSNMIGSPMVIMWFDPEGNVVLSQRHTSAQVMPTVDNNPPRIATALSSLSLANATQPKLGFSIPANSDTQQVIIWAFSTVQPESSAADAVLQQHLNSGTLALDLTRSIADPSTLDSPAQTGSSSSSNPITHIPLLPYEKLIVAHAILCTVGFLFFLPAGALFARYLRTVNSSWFLGHWIIQFVVAGTIIVAGIACTIQSVIDVHAPHFSDTHKKWGLAIFILYFVQCSLGAFIHFVKPKTWNFRPPQNYLHAIIGLLIISLAFYQVRTGYTHEWVFATGRPPLPRVVNILWYVWVVLLPVLYVAGLALLPRQFAQEREAKVANQAQSFEVVNPRGQ